MLRRMNSSEEVKHLPRAKPHLLLRERMPSLLASCIGIGVVSAAKRLPGRLQQMTTLSYMIIRVHHSRALHRLIDKSLLRSLSFA